MRRSLVAMAILGLTLLGSVAAARGSAADLVEPPHGRSVVAVAGAPGVGNAALVPDPAPDELLPAGTTWTTRPTETDVSYGPDPRQSLDIYRPAEPNGLAVVWIHGGGWIGGHNRGETPLAADLHANGAVVVAINYRLGPEHVFPAQLHDVKRALRFVKSRQAELEFDRLVLLGHSAGGHLALLAATTAGDLEPTDLPDELDRHDSSVDGAIAVAAPVDLTRLWRNEHDWAKRASDGFLGCDGSACLVDRMRAASPTTWVDPADPPIYIVDGLEDSLVPSDEHGAVLWRTYRERTGDPTRAWFDPVEHLAHNTWPGLNRAAVEHFLAGITDA